MRRVTLVDAVAHVIAIVVVTSCAACAGDADGDPPEGGPPDPARFATAECETSTPNAAAELVVGVGFEGFAPADESKALPIVDVDGASFAYFSVRVQHSALREVCLQYRLDVAEPDEPNEAVAFDRFLLDLEADPPDGGLVRGIGAAIEDADALRGKRALLVVDAADGLVSGHAEAFATFE